MNRYIVSPWNPYPSSQLSSHEDIVHDWKKNLRRELLDSRNVREYDTADFYRFIAQLRALLRADVDRGIYPEVRIDGMKIGATFRGLLYDKSSGRTLSRSMAFDIYARLYRLYRNRSLSAEDLS
jgi:hypothetical protein